ncbi:MAG: prepilin-type N-terminal cleavage/methylation domain-containing protein [Pirellulales bacterium]|nr:prepilin-type N-terminal cleavage/methylation domain-containing protein [Pirellulales bacterium]
MEAAAANRPPRRAFTLVEILIVIVIIGMLVGLTLPAVIAARNRAKEAVIKTDLDQLSMAIQHYKGEYGDYPPDFFGVNDSFPDDIRQPARAAVLRHLARTFPRLVPESGADVDARWNNFRTHFANHHPTLGLDLDDLTPASALVFWLGGLPDPASKQLQGFSANPAHPFEAGGPRRAKLNDFDETRLRGFDESTMTWTEWPTYAPKGAKLPYVYFKPRTDATSTRMEYAVDTSGSPATGGGTGPMQPFFCKFDDNGRLVADQWTGASTNICVPYLRDIVPAQTNPAAAENPTTDRVWMERDKFQIISPGLDEQFGDQPVAAAATDFRNAITGENLSVNGGDLDNITNFSEGRLENGIKP